MSGAADAALWSEAAQAPEEPEGDPHSAATPRRVPARLRIALALSVLAHGVLLSLALGGDALGLPGLQMPWKERRLGADDLRIVLAPAAEPVAPAPAVAPPPPAPAPAAPPSRGAPVVLPPPAAPVAAAPARPTVNLPLAPDAPATRAAAEVVAPVPVGGADDAARKQREAAAQARAVEQARVDEARVEREAAQREAVRQEQLKAEATAREDAARQEAARQAQHDAARKAQAQQDAARQEALKQESARQDAVRQEAVRQEAVRQEEARQEAARQEAARQELTRQEAARQELARQEASRQEAARQEASRQEAARQEASRQEAARQEAARQEAARREASRQEAARQETSRQDAARQAQARQDQAQRERAEQEAKREERLRAIGQQMKQEAAQRDGPPTTSSLRRGWLFGRADANAELVEYAQAMSRKIEMNMTFDMVRELVKQPHAQPVVTVAVRADGSVEKVTFVVSSGVPAIDEAIRKVVESQAPFGRFPPALARQYDVVEIRRTWIFDMAIRLQ